MLLSNSVFGLLAIFLLHATHKSHMPLSMLSRQVLIDYKPCPPMIISILINIIIIFGSIHTSIIYIYWSLFINRMHYIYIEGHYLCIMLIIIYIYWSLFINNEQLCINIAHYLHIMFIIYISGFIIYIYWSKGFHLLEPLGSLCLPSTCGNAQ